MINLEEELGKLLLFGVGAAAISIEKAKDMIIELVKKGELTVNQSKILNEELKYNKKSMTNSNKELITRMDKMSKEELAAIKEKLNSMEE